MASLSSIEEEATCKSIKSQSSITIQLEDKL